MKLLPNPGLVQLSESSSQMLDSNWDVLFSDVSFEPYREVSDSLASTVERLSVSLRDHAIKDMSK